MSSWTGIHNKVTGEVVRVPWLNTIQSTKRYLTPNNNNNNEPILHQAQNNTVLLKWLNVINYCLIQILILFNSLETEHF